MTPAHIPSLRWALCSMLADTDYDEAAKDRPNVEARLGEAGWPEQVCRQLQVLALRWVSTQRDDVRAAMRKALGEELNEIEAAMLPSQARLSSTKHALSTSLEGDVPVTIAELTTPYNGTIVVPKDSAVSELYGEPDWTELERQARLMRSAPWDEPQERLDKAVNAIKAGRVSLGVPATSLAYVKSEDDKRTYTVRDTGCTCRATRPCYHLTAAELYRLWQDKISPPSLFPTPKTVDERLAEMPPASPQDAPGATIGSQDDTTDVPEGALPLLDDADAKQEDSDMATLPVNDLEMSVPTLAPLPTTLLTGCDLTPMTLPGGGERSRTMGQLMAALARAQRSMRNPTTDSRNPHLQNRYVSGAGVRDAVIPALAAEGIATTQFVVRQEQELVCYTMLGHTSGEYLMTPIAVPLSATGKGRSDTQERGATITYVKRYALQAVAVVSGDVDDDGEEERGTPPKREAVPPASRPQDDEQRRGVLQREIDTLLTTHHRDATKAWERAEGQYGRARAMMTVADLEDFKARITRAVTEPTA